MDLLIVRLYDLYTSETSENWLRYGRLKELADKGDEEARKEYERIDNDEMFTI